jgi:predicted O-methyltransferase YrrM
MSELEEQTERDQRSLRSVNTDVGRLLLMLAMSAPQGAFLELGSSGGYSSLWLSVAAHAKGVTLTTVDLDEKKVAVSTAQRRLAPAQRAQCKCFTVTLLTTPAVRPLCILLLRYRNRRRTTLRSMNS